MPLFLVTVQSEFANLIDKNSPSFVGHGLDAVTVATNWANVLFNYASAVIPVSTSATVAKNAMISILSGAAAPGSFFPLLISAYSTFAATLASGMTAGGVGAPPPAPIDFSPITALPLSDNSVPQIISLFASITDTWFRTGTFTFTNGTVVTWN